MKLLNNFVRILKPTRIIFSRGLSSWTRHSADNGYYPAQKTMNPTFVQQSDLQKSTTSPLLSIYNIIPQVKFKPRLDPLESSLDNINNTLLPSFGFGRLGKSLPIAILDPATTNAYNCPDSSQISEISDPIPDSGHNVQDFPTADNATEKLALNIMKRRRLKIKKLQYKRQLKRNFALIRKRKLKEKRIKKKKTRAKIESLKFKQLQPSDIEEYVKNREELKEINGRYFEWESKTNQEVKIRRKIVYK